MDLLSVEIFTSIIVTTSTARFTLIGGFKGLQIPIDLALLLRVFL